ncbi:hypothetical protein [Burkholderia sp.]|uniref:hypothetical protein n=1 Tax=Burkholderia sp. TaxID=36773 RepID=UPI0025B7EDA9|nr:hypothetical protein [Burkholderia sp.]MBS6360568.1 hypothetical protein [Burkholderia sp.]
MISPLFPFATRPASADSQIDQAGLENDAIVPADTWAFAPAYRLSHFDRPAAVLAYEAGRHEERETVKEFLALEENWDGYDSYPISKEAGAAAESFLVGLPSNIESPELTPNAAGTITFEWERGEARASLELGKRKCSFYLKQPGTQTIYHTGDLQSFVPIFGLLHLLAAKAYSLNNTSEY